jgi:hypothetical protein
VDRAEIERLLEQLSAERETLRSRLTAVTKAAEGLEALLEMTPVAGEWPSRPGSDAGQAEVTHARETQHIVPAVLRAAKDPPRGMRAVRLILESDTSRYWNVREVSDEEVRRGWAEPRLRGAKGNPPARAALDRLKSQYPDNVDVIKEPILAFRWTPDASLSLNGSGASRAEEVPQ